MAYIIKEVEKLTGISSHTLRFWAKKGLFPFVQKDHNQVRYFANSDVDWARFIECMRSVGMSIEHIKDYIALCQKGVESIEERKAMLVAQREETIKKIQAFSEALNHLDYKIAFYEEMSKNNQDPLNPMKVGSIRECMMKKSKK
ncbi:MerR family transcriptional regulator [Helicobacter brantae]|uniref:MerR family transcriptional regulator n=1 Tax=Helicobacter brantae TaxID=375927 RepID=A0A3D8J3N1_9HELI|nr:MerR family transcriptional regulator [Helicobacter brantae]RDU72088.1 MerR family transcriptional regulator [Helicobacter brantae]